MSGIFGSSQWMYASGGFYNGVATQSLRLNPADTLTKTYTTPTSSKIMSFGGWVKRQKTGKYSNLYSGSLGGGGVPQGFIYFNDTNDKLECFSYTGSSYVFNYATTRVFRDVGSWYHIWVQIDTTDATQADRVKIYVNGIRETSFSTETQVGSGSPDVRGLNESGITQYFGHTNSFYGGDVYYSDWYFIDGSAVSPVDTVGEFKNGVFIAKSYSSTFGNNGWHLEFNQTGTGTASSSTIGADTSGNANHFTSSGIVSSDCDMPDSPENNFATWNGVSSFATDNSEGNLKASASSGNANSRTNSTIPISSGKWYFEVRLDDAGTNTTVGIAEQASPATYPGQLAGDYVQELDNARKGNNNSFTSYGTSLTTGDIFNCAVDLDNGEIYFGKNGTYFNSSNPATNTSPAFSSIPSGLYTIVTRPYSSATEAIIVSLNAGQDSTFAGAVSAGGNADGNGIGDFKYAVPSGYLALCSANLPEPTISPNEETQADDYFNTVLYNGNGSTQSITGVGFQSDLVWMKSRSAATSHHLADVVRGIGSTSYLLLSNSTAAESSSTTNIIGVDSDGFTVGASTAVNNSGQTYVAWNWKAGGTAVFNTDGTITSSVSANTDAGFSIVSYTGNATASTIGHGLNKTPSMVIVKERGGARPWVTYHASNTSAPETDYLRLNETNGTADFDMWNDTAPTSSVFSVSSYDWVNNNASPFIAYCFAEIEGYSKFGSYTGNGNADGTFVYTGFRPAWIMMKDTDTGDWMIYDTERNLFNLSGKYLQANNSGAEGSETNGIDILSNGFKQRNTFTNLNSSGNTYIYMSFAENPFKYSLGR